MATLPGLPDQHHPEEDPQALPVEPEMEPRVPGVPDDPEGDRVVNPAD